MAATGELGAFGETPEPSKTIKVDLDSLLLDISNAIEEKRRQYRKDPLSIGGIGLYYIKPVDETLDNNPKIPEVSAPTVE
jgi:hypothetical protein